MRFSVVLFPNRSRPVRFKVSSEEIPIRVCGTDSIVFDAIVVDTLRRGIFVFFAHHKVGLRISTGILGCSVSRFNPDAA